MSGGRTLAIGMLLLTSLVCRDVRSDEPIVLRETAGRSDVPLLPSKPYRYAIDKLPSHIDVSALQSMDNTPVDNPITDAVRRWAECCSTIGSSPRTTRSPVRHAICKSRRSRTRASSAEVLNTATPTATP